MAGHIERIKNLDQIERDIASALEHAGSTVQELGKDKPNNKSVETYTNAFLKTVNNVEGNLMKQIAYLSQVSTGHPHTGSSYGAQKDWQMSMKRLDHVKERLEELERLKNEQMATIRQTEMRRHIAQHGSFGQSAIAIQQATQIPPNAYDMNN